MVDDVKTLSLVGGVLALLLGATTIGQRLKNETHIGLNPALVDAFNQRIRAWWLMCTVLAAAFLLGPISRVATVILFGLISFWALREFVTLTPTRLGDHRTLFWVFFLFTPLQYVLVGLGVPRYELLFSVLIPVYAFLFIPARVAMAGDYKRFLERTAKIQSGLMVCVYCLSYAPALLSLEIPGYEGQTPRLLFFFVIVVQLNDVLQYAWGKLLGQHVIAPAISPSRTWEGCLGGIASATLIGTALWWATPFEPWEAAGLSLVIAIMGFAGGMTMSAIKRDRGVKDYGTLVVGHGGVLDRIDSICFAAPVFYHLTRFFFVPLT
ncbi:MAG TPA: phosphatidate cytidylyltransferase [Pirellulales bacterium]|jgi:phosphatidate cytidylyltransferase|nr:phosphatidate cytidylyltransferase [Pirellulales bacterium]